MQLHAVTEWMSADEPHVILQTMRRNGSLRECAPEVDRLYGVPQRADHHPEVDTGLHIELALEVAATLSHDPAVRYATLVHDLGKALTPAAEWPRHIGHEELGVAPGLELGERLGVPAEWRKLGALVSRYHLHAHRASDVPPRSLVRLFRDSGLFERPELVTPFTLACEADARGRGGRQSNSYPQGERLRTAFAIATNVRVENSARLHEARIRAVTEQMV